MAPILHRLLASSQRTILCTTYLFRSALLQVGRRNPPNNLSAWCSCQNGNRCDRLVRRGRRGLALVDVGWLEMRRRWGRHWGIFWINRKCSSSRVSKISNSSSEVAILRSGPFRLACRRSRSAVRRISRVRGRSRLSNIVTNRIRHCRIN